MSLEAEVTGHAEALRLKEMETDQNKMEIQVDRANRNNSELVKTLNKLQQHLRVNWRGCKQVPEWESMPVVFYSLSNKAVGFVLLFRLSS